MTKGRLEAFSDAVIAIILTIMVLELRPPHEPDLNSLRDLLPVILSYVMSFVYLGIYWNNHHHMLQAAKRVNGAALWANLHLLFWLSLVPFTTAWMGETSFAKGPVALYGIVLLFCGVAYYVLSRVLVRHEGPDSLLSQALGSDRKGQISIVLYAVAVAVSHVWPAVSCSIYIIVALMWLVPDRRFERAHSRAD